MILVCLCAAVLLCCPAPFGPALFLLCVYRPLLMLIVIVLLVHGAVHCYVFSCFCLVLSGLQFPSLLITFCISLCGGCSCVYCLFLLMPSLSCGLLRVRCFMIMAVVFVVCLGCCSLWSLLPLFPFVVEFHAVMCPPVALLYVMSGCCRGGCCCCCALLCFVCSCCTC